MYFRIFIIGAFGAFFVNGFGIVHPGSRYPPTKGEVWPKPQYQRKEEIKLIFKPSQFRITALSNNCDILRKAIERYSFTLRTYQNIARRWKQKRRKFTNLTNSIAEGTDTMIHELQVDLTSACEEYPYLGMDESYELTVDQTSLLRSKSIWGILRGLESFSHLFYLSDDYTEVLIKKTVILDFPRYLHRGLLLDTSRHFISLNNILKTLNAMSMNKMNVFHWHIVDDESFPYQSEKFPELSARGAFHQSMIYTKSDIQTVIKYATDRGIRVVPEFDAPGHTRSWGEAYPDILTKCYRDNKVVGLGPMDPTKNDTYTLLGSLIEEVQAWFPDKYFHVGGDEVELDCWSSNPELKNYMKEHNINTQELHALFMQNVIPLLKNKSTAIVWQEVFDEHVPLNNDVLVQVWKNQWVPEMVKVLKSGHKVLFSASWYLDHLKNGGDWRDFYKADPRAMVYQLVDETLLANIIGGEACMWGEVVNDANVISRVWPRASAVAERLWSPLSVERATVPQDEADSASFRLEEHTCRMNRRGVAAQPPNGPGLCLTANNF